MTESIKILYKEGGVRRFYRGYLPALAQGPLSRYAVFCSFFFHLSGVIDAAFLKELCCVY